MRAKAYTVITVARSKPAHPSQSNELRRSCDNAIDTPMGSSTRSGQRGTSATAARATTSIARGAKSHMPATNA